MERASPADQAKGKTASGKAVASRHAIVVLGMHRSGTSAFARVMSLLGAALPAEMFPPAPDNPTGFWEPREIAAMNDEILGNADSEWDDVFAFKLDSSHSNFNHYYFSKAQELIESNYGASQLIVLKEPRISVLVPFWERVLTSCGYQPTYVIAVRHPEEIADSLLKRGGLPHKKSFLIWASYMIAAATDTRGKTRIFASYDDLLKDPLAVTERIEEAAGFPFPRKTAAAEIEIRRFLSPELRHHSTAPNAQLPWPWATELYGWLLSAVRGEAPSEKDLEKIRLELANVEDVAGSTIADLKLHVRGLEARLRETERQAREEAAQALSTLQSQTQSDLDAMTARLSQAEQELGEERNLRVEEVERLRRALEAETHALAALNAEHDLQRTIKEEAVNTAAATSKELADLKDEFSAQKAAVRLLEARIAVADEARSQAEALAATEHQRASDVSAVLARQIGHAAETEQAVNEQRRRVRSLTEDVAHLSKALAAEREHLNHQRASMSSTQARLAELEQQRDFETLDKRARLDAASDELARNASLIADLKAEHETAQADLAGAQDALEAIRSSTSWRATGPIRRILTLFR